LKSFSRIPKHLTGNSVFETGKVLSAIQIGNLVSDQNREDVYSMGMPYQVQARNSADYTRNERLESYRNCAFEKTGEDWYVLYRNFEFSPNQT
jgi:hypothetical protein